MIALNSFENSTKSEKTMLIFCLAFSVLVLLFSFSQEYIWKIKPCHLCNLQRIPYGMIFFISAFGILSRFQKAAVFLVKLSFVFCLFLASFHLLVQAGLISDSCVVPSNIKSIEQLRNLIETPKPCATISWKLLGLPISAYNMLFSILFLSLLSRSNKKKLIIQ